MAPHGVQWKNFAIGRTAAVTWALSATAGGSESSVPVIVVVVIVSESVCGVRGGDSLSEYGCTRDMVDEAFVLVAVSVTMGATAVVFIHGVNPASAGIGRGR
jgi:hypothetical protein